MWVFILLGVALVILIIIFILCSYTKAGPDEAIMISGLGKRKILRGKAGWKIPFLQRKDRLSLKVFQVDIKTRESIPTNEFININVDGVANLKISSDPELLERAFEATLGMNQDDLIEQVISVSHICLDETARIVYYGKWWLHGGEVMRLLIQRVLNASVVADGIETGSIGKGFLILLGICDRDTKETVDRMLAKTVRLRIFEDSNGKTNLSLGDVGGAVLLVSQFTLYADCRKGNRPSFTDAGSPDHAKQLYEYAAEQLNSLYGIHTETGVFGADMKVSLVNDGPFTVMLDSDALNM